MSLVGTRPPTVDEWDKYELHHRARLATKPGLTGMWQVSGRSNITDLLVCLHFYCLHCSSGLEIKIKELGGYGNSEMNRKVVVNGGKRSTENNPVEKNTVAGKTAKAKEKELEEWLRGLDGMDGIYHDVLWRDVFQIDAINLPRHLFIICHPGWCNKVREFE